MEIAMTGEGEIVIRFIDKTGKTLLQERIRISGSPSMAARRVVDLALGTERGRAQLAPVLISQSNQEQVVTFDGEAPPAFTRRRCKQIGCNAKATRDAARGSAPAPVPVHGPGGASDDRGLERALKAALREGARR